MEAQDIRLDQIIIALLGLLGVVFGGGAGIWAWLAARGKTKANGQVKELTEQREAVRLATQTMLAANSALQTTITFLRTRLTEANTDYVELQTAGDLASAVSNGLEAELRRRLRILQVQYDDLRCVLTAKTLELEQARTRIAQLTQELSSDRPTQPLDLTRIEKENQHGTDQESA